MKRMLSVLSYKSVIVVPFNILTDFYEPFTDENLANGMKSLRDLILFVC